jgi:membrane-associated protease RseP (regulator of RpoE activity)
MNLFNLSAIPFLDGGRIVPLIPPKVLLGGLIAVAAINYRCPLSWLMLMFALPHIFEHWKKSPIGSLGVRKQDQQTYTLAYLGMALLLGFASLTTQDWITELRRLTRYH